MLSFRSSRFLDEATIHLRGVDLIGAVAATAAKISAGAERSAPRRRTNCASDVCLCLPRDWKKQFEVRAGESAIVDTTSARTSDGLRRPRYVSDQRRLLHGARDGCFGDFQARLPRSAASSTWSSA